MFLLQDVDEPPVNSLTDDDEKPVVTCPDDIIRYVVPGVTSLNVTFPNATATDNSGKASLIYVTPPSGSLFQLGTSGVQYVFEDESGNVGSCRFAVTVNGTAGKLSKFIKPMGSWFNIYYVQSSAKAHEAKQNRFVGLLTTLFRVYLTESPRDW